MNSLIKKKPKVELKNITFFEGHDGIGLSADVWINGIKCMRVYDDASGGQYKYDENVRESDIVKKNIKLLDDYVNSLPKQKTSYGELKIDRDYYIDMVLHEQLKF